MRRVAITLTICNGACKGLGVKGEGQLFARSPISSHFHLLLCFAHSSVRESIERAREERNEGR